MHDRVRKLLDHWYYISAWEFLGQDIDFTSLNFLASTRTVRLEINRETQYRKIVGFGGAFTGAVSYLLEKLPQAVQDHMYK